MLCNGAGDFTPVRFHFCEMSVAVVGGCFDHRSCISLLNPSLDTLCDVGNNEKSSRKANASEGKAKKLCTLEIGFYNPLCLGFLQILVFDRVLISHFQTGLSVSFCINIFSSYTVYCMLVLRVHWVVM